LLQSKKPKFSMLARMLYFDNFELTKANFLNVLLFICNMQNAYNNCMN